MRILGVRTRRGVSARKHIAMASDYPLHFVCRQRFQQCQSVAEDRSFMPSLTLLHNNTCSYTWSSLFFVRSISVTSQYSMKERCQITYIYRAYTMHSALCMSLTTKKQPKMSPTTPSKQPSAAASSPQFIVPQSPRSAYPRTPDRRLSMQPVSRRSSNQSIKQALISRSRANSMANSRRPSRAGSQQSGTVVAQEGQAAVPVPAGFGNSFDLNNWDLTDPTFDVGFGDLGSDFGFEDFAPLPNVGTANPCFNCSSSRYVQVASYDQFGRPLVPGGIDPQLLTQQPYGLVNSTPGLTAVPGAGDLFPMQPMQYMQPMQPMQYADPNLMYMPQAQPYFPQGGYVQTGYTPIEQTATQQLPQVDPAPVRKSDKRPHSDSDSEDEAPAPKRRQPTKQVKSNKRPVPKRRKLTRQ
jgi:hypothetical protein